MKKSVAVAIIAILAVAAVALGVLYATNNDSMTKQISARETEIKDRDLQIRTLTEDAEAKAVEIDSLTADVEAKAGEIKTLTEDAEAKAGEIETLTADVAAKAGEIGTLTEAVTARDGQIDTLNQLVASKEEEIGALTADAEAKTAQIETLTADAEAKAAQIETLTADAETKAAQIETMTADAEAKAGQIETLTADAEAKAAQIETLTAEVAAKTEEIEKLTADVQDKAAQIVAMTADAAEKAAQIAAKDSVIAGKDEQIAELEAAATELQGQIETLTAEIGEKEEQIRALSADRGETPEKPEEPEERLVHREDRLTVTLPAGIRYDLGVQPNRVREFTDAETEDASKDMFMIMKIDMGIDVSDLGDSLTQMMIAAIQAEIDKTEEIKDAYFEQTELLGHPAMNMGFTYELDDEQAPAYGTIMVSGQNAYIFFYASLTKGKEEVKAEMLECIAGITEDAEEPAPEEPAPEEPAPEEPAPEEPVPEEPAPEEPAPEDPATGEYPADGPALRFGMSRDEIKELLGEWDEEANVTDGYDVVRYKDTIFRGYNSIFALVTTENGLHMWLYGIENEGKAFEELAEAFAKDYEAYDGGAGELIEVFGALGLNLTEQQLELAARMGMADYRYYRVDDGTKAILLTVNYDGKSLTVVGFAQVG